MEDAWVLPALPAAGFVLLLLLSPWLPRKGDWLAITLMTAAFVLTLVIGRDVQNAIGDGGFEGVARSWQWSNIPGFIEIRMGTFVDQITLVMLFVVSLVATLVMVYSTSYMHGDRRYGWFYAIAYFLLVFVFTYFYTAVTFDPENISNNLQKSGGFISGVRPGQSTSEYIAKIVTRITLVGALFLGFIAVLPLIMKSLTGISSLAIGGTALLIAVSVVIDLVKKIEAQVSMREY